MGGLSAFLAENAEQVENVKYVASKRFKDEYGNPVEWELRCITSAEDEELRKSCQKRVPIQGKRGLTTQETDSVKYLGKLAAACTVFPNLDASELQDSYGVMGADVLLKAMLTPGEYTDFITTVQSVNGFDKSFEDLVEEVKN